MIRSKVDTWRAQEAASSITDLADLHISDQGWRQQAACRNMDDNTFFPSKKAERWAEPAKTICAHCPVKAECLTYALETNQTYGVWGGLRQSELAKLRRDRAAA